MVGEQATVGLRLGVVPSRFMVVVLPPHLSGFLLRLTAE